MPETLIRLRMRVTKTNSKKSHDKYFELEYLYYIHIGKFVMSQGFQRSIIQGNLGADPEVRYQPNGNAVTSLSVATSETWTDNNGKKMEHTEWHKVVLFRRQAEIAGEYLKKGDPVLIEGKVRTRKWKDQNNETRYTQEVIADGLTLISSGKRVNNTEAESPTIDNKPKPQKTDDMSDENARYSVPNRPREQSAEAKKVVEDFFGES